MAFSPANLVGTRVIDLPKNHKVLVRGTRAGTLSDVAVIATYSQSGKITRSTTELVSQLLGNGYLCFLVVATDYRGRLERPALSLPSPELTMVQRRNLGYDFGSWATALEIFPEIRRSQRVLLVNDSMVGPFRSIDVLLDSFESSEADMWGLIESPEVEPHFQSYCLGFNNGVLDRGPLREFWRDVRLEETKEQLIMKYELGLSILARSSGLKMEALFGRDSLVQEVKNPSQFGWKSILDSGVPLVKRELLIHPGITPDSNTIPEELNRRYSVDVSEWW